MQWHPQTCARHSNTAVLLKELPIQHLVTEIQPKISLSLPVCLSVCLYLPLPPANMQW